MHTHTHTHTQLERAQRRCDMCITLLHRFRELCGPTTVVIRVRTHSSQTWGQSVMQPEAFELLSAVSDLAEGRYAVSSDVGKFAMKMSMAMNSMGIGGGTRLSSMVQQAQAQQQALAQVLGDGLNGQYPPLVLVLVSRLIREDTAVSDHLKRCYDRATDIGAYIPVKACLPRAQQLEFVVHYLNVAPEDVSTDLFQIVSDMSAGNPKDIEEVLEYWKKEGLLTVHVDNNNNNINGQSGDGQQQQSARVETSPEGLLMVSIPQAIIGNLREGFDQLSTNIQELVKALSLLEEPISQHMVQLIIDADDEMKFLRSRAEYHRAVALLIDCEILEEDLAGARDDNGAGLPKLSFKSQVMRRLASEIMLTKRRTHLITVIERQEQKLVAVERAKEAERQLLSRDRFRCDFVRLYRSAHQGAIIVTRFMRFTVMVKHGMLLIKNHGQVPRSLTRRRRFMLGAPHIARPLGRVSFQKRNLRKSAYNITALPVEDQQTIRMQGILLKEKGDHNVEKRIIAIGKGHKAELWTSRFFRVFGHYLQYYTDKKSKVLKGVVNLHSLCGCWVHADKYQHAVHGQPQSRHRLDTVIALAFSPAGNVSASPSTVAASIVSYLHLKAESQQIALEWADVFMHFLLVNVLRWTEKKRRVIKQQQREQRKQREQQHQLEEQETQLRLQLSNNNNNNNNNPPAVPAPAPSPAPPLQVPPSQAPPPPATTPATTPATAHQHAAPPPPVHLPSLTLDDELNAMSIPMPSSNFLAPASPPHPGSQPPPHSISRDPSSPQRASAIVDLTDPRTMDAVRQDGYLDTHQEEGETRIFL